MTMAEDNDVGVIEWSLSDRIRKARRLLGMEQTEFGDMFSVTDKAVSRWEAGGNPRDIVRVAQVIEQAARERGIRGLTAHWLLFGEGFPLRTESTLSSDLDDIWQQEFALT